MMAAMQHIRSTPRDWDMIELRWVAADSTEGGKSARALRVAGLLTEKQEYMSTSIIDLPATWDEFQAAKSQPLRRQFRRTIRDTFESGKAEFIRHRPLSASQGDGDPGWEIYDMCEAVAQASWQSAVTHGNTITHTRVRDFFRAAHAAAARIGMVDVNVMLVDGSPAAFLYGYHCQGNVAALRTGFDAAFGGGTGSALVLRSIQDSCHRGDRTIDFGPGEREHKRRLRTRTESTYRLTYTPMSSWRSQTVRWTRWAKNHWPRRVAAAAAV
jgi:hypothetical protein